jgi:protoporphyrinogen/coproporphyrinogen III oxidase
MKVAIVGAGISGLTTAFLLKRKGVDVTVYEAGDRPGGNVQTVTSNGYTIEQGPNSLLRTPRMVELVESLAISDSVIGADASAKKRYILSGGKLEALGPKSFVNGYFSPRTLIGLATEPFVRSKSPIGESVSEFVSRRIGREFLEKAIDPFVSGVYAGDPDNLSMRSAFPKLFEMERDFGSLIMGTFRRTVEKVDENFPRTFSFKGGLKTLIYTLADRVGQSLRLETKVQQITKAPTGFEIDGESFDAVVISTPAYVAAELICSFDAELGEMLSGVHYPQVAVAVSGFRSEKIGRKLDGFGFLIPSKEKRPILGTLFHSAVFPERSPEGHQLLMTFIGGVRAGDQLDSKSDEELKTLVTEQLKEILDVNGEPDFFHVKRWKRAIPQYRVGYEKVTAACEQFEKNNPGLLFCSNFYRGISMGDCVKNAFQTADTIIRTSGSIYHE